MLLQNRNVAWLITIAIMITGLFLGSYMSFRNMRADAVGVFREEVEPVLHEQMQMVYNMLTIYRLNTAGTQVFANSVNELIERIQAGIQTVSHDLPNDLWLLKQHSEAMYRQGDELNLNDSDARFMRNFYIDIQELQTVISQSSYNIKAQEFNETTGRGLGFLTQWLGVFGNRQLPVF